MKETIKRLYMNMPIGKKLLYSMLLLVLATIMITFFVYSGLFTRNQLQSVSSESRNSVSAASNTMNGFVKRLYMNIFFMADKDEFKALSTTASAQEMLLSNMSPILDNLAATNELIDNILLITPQGNYFSQKASRLITTQYGMDLYPDSPQSEITWLSVRNSPYIVPGSVIPISFSFTQSMSYDGVLSTFTLAHEEPDIRMFVFLNAARVNALLQADETSSQSMIYLAEAKTLSPLSISEGSPFHEVTSAQAFRESSLRLEGSEGTVEHGGKEYYVFLGPVLDSGLRILRVLSKDEMLSSYQEINMIIIGVTMLLLLVTTVIVSISARLISRPINKLAAYVSQNAPGSTPGGILQYGDEIGQLGKAIERMNRTIARQMETIKEDERKNAEAEIRVLTQQINPHFIYNTLDCIRWEIEAGNTEGADNMVQTLASFLRLGFSSKSTTGIADEIRRLEQYLSIINQRVNGHIALFSYIEESLATMQIPRMLLQPLVENCIKHGFSGSANEPGRLTISQPQIFVYLKQVDGDVVLGVEDNGSGIDIVKANASLEDSADAPEEHIGLRNSMLRLGHMFGTENVSISFSSIPWFSNIIEFTIRRP